MRRKSKRSFNVLGGFSNVPAVFLPARSFSLLEDLAAVVVLGGNVLEPGFD